MFMRFNPRNISLAVVLIAASYLLLLAFAYEAAVDLVAIYAIVMLLMTSIDMILEHFNGR